MTLAFALILDSLLGEPRWVWSRLPHPAVLMGRTIGWFDRHFNHGALVRAKGAVAIVTAVMIASALGLAITAVPGQILDVVVAATLLAHRSLITHVTAVADGLRLSLPEGRRSVAMIVSRDTSAMDAPAVSRAAIESAAENLSDGVIAPAFYFAVAGLPGMLAYKMVNTADSMIGYRTPQYRDFGWAAARLDDVLNWIPSRLTAALIWLASAGRGNWTRIRADARLHRSPNAGWPEAALAPALNLALAGPRSYDGFSQEFPFVNPQGRHDAGPADIDAATTQLWRAWSLALLLTVVFAIMAD